MIMPADSAAVSLPPSSTPVAENVSGFPIGDDYQVRALMTGAEFSPLSPGAAAAGAAGAAAMAACLARVQQGDQRAATELVAAVRPLVLRIVRRRLPRRAAEEDLVQEVLIKMFSRLAQYHGGAPFTHWLSRIALRTCFDHLRAQRCRPELRRADLAEEINQRLDATLADLSHGHPGDRLGAREIVARALADMSMAEISQTTGWDVEFVKMRLFRARGKLQRLVMNMPKWDALGCPQVRQTARSKKKSRNTCAELSRPSEAQAA
jgi:RNA polymerase sigma-70 factor (ECF subfamily)